jgi:hypothetical protein
LDAFIIVIGTRRWREEQEVEEEVELSIEEASMRIMSSS